MHSTEPRGHFIMDLEAEEALRELEAGQQEPSVAPQLPLQDQQTMGSSPGFEIFCSGFWRSQITCMGFLKSALAQAVLGSTCGTLNVCVVIYTFLPLHAQGLW